MKAVLDCALEPRLLDTRFSRFPVDAKRWVGRDKGAVHFRLPAEKGVGFTCLYSTFAIAGDFEVSANYQVRSLPPPQKGYGISFGIAVETKEPKETVSFARGQRLKEPPSYLINRGKVVEGKMAYETANQPTKAREGRLVMRRDKAEIICLAADGKAELTELWRVPFPEGTIRALQLFADPGGSPTAVDVRLSDIRIRAAEITGGIPESEARGGLGWWLAGAALAIAAGIAFVVIRRRRSDDDDD